MRRFLSFALALTLLLGCGAAYAAPAEETGYIVELVPGAVMPLALEEGITSLGGGFLAVEDKETLAQLAAAGLVAHVEKDVPVYLHTTNDPYYSNSAQQNYQWHLDAVNAPAAWARDIDLSGVTVAVVDSGVIPAHEDLANILPGVDFSGDVYSENTRDTMGHGTAVTGIIAAVRDNGKGVAGAAYGVNILPLKVFSSANKTDLSCIIQAIDYAIEKDVDVINISAGSEDNSYALEAVIKRAVREGIIVVASGGNGGTAPVYPAALENVVGVSFVDKNLNIHEKSSRSEAIFVTAPGVFITTLSHESYSRYSVHSGSSMSAPIVSAAAAYCRAVDPEMTAAEFMELLRTTSTDLGDAGYDVCYGNGLVDFAAIMEALLPAETKTEIGMERVEITDSLVTVCFENENEILSDGAQAAVAAENASKDVLLRGANFAVTVPAGMLGSVMDYVPRVEGLQSGDILFCETDAGTHAVGASLVRDGVLYGVACCEGRYYTASNPKSFTDTTSHWGAGAVGFMAARELFNGVGGEAFDPNGTMNRAMLVTVLSRLACAKNAPSGSFSDVRADQWYAAAVGWAAECGITSGYEDGTFRPTNAITRAEAVTMLQRFAALGGQDTASAVDGVSAYPDGEEAPAWSVDALNWALERGLLTGRSNGTLDPSGTATRAELATILMRYIQNVIFA